MSCVYCTSPENDCVFPDCAGGWEDAYSSLSEKLRAANDLSDKCEELLNASSIRQFQLTEKVVKLEDALREIVDATRKHHELSQERKDLKYPEHNVLLKVSYDQIFTAINSGAELLGTDGVSNGNS